MWLCSSSTSIIEDRDLSAHLNILTIRPAPSRWSWVAWGVAAASLGLAVLAWAPWRATRPVQHPLVRLDVDLGPEISLPVPDNNTSSVVLTPDGTRLVYVASVAGDRRRNRSGENVYLRLPIPRYQVCQNHLVFAQGTPEAETFAL
jgi:hypothetical protein